MPLAEGEDEDDNLSGKQIPVSEPVFVPRYLNCPSGNVKFYYNQAEVLHYICFSSLRSFCW